MFSFFNYISTNTHMMWLKICYVLKNNKDRLLGYIHIPTKQDHLNEEIRWVQARQKERLRRVTPELDAEECRSPTQERKLQYESGETLSYQEIDNMPCVQTLEQDFTGQIISPAENDENSGLPRKEFSVEIRYEPGSGVIRTTDHVSPKAGRERPLSLDSTDEDTRRAHLEEINFDNKIRFIYSRGDDGDEEILRVPSHQEEFNRGAW